MILFSRFAQSLLVSALAITASAAGHAHGIAEIDEADPQRRIEFPNTADHLTLVVDLHTHSVFSDGHVWPRIRIGEAMRDGLDAIAITEHLEWQPHLQDIPHPDRNRAYQEALAARGETDLIVIAGSEITRNPPANHMNAVFIADANQLLQPPASAIDPADAAAYYEAAGTWPAQEAVQAANTQGAFVFWNHPYFGGAAPDGIARMNEFHRANAQAGLLHGIEIANGDTYSEEAFQIALDHGLTVIGVSDVHNLIDWDYEPHAGGHRPVNLVFTKERTADAIKTALFAKRTVVWYRNLLLGRTEHLAPLLSSSLVIGAAAYEDDSQVLSVTLENRSDARFQLQNLSRYTFAYSADLIEVAPHATVDLLVKTGDPVEELSLEFAVLNALTAPKQPARIQLATTVARSVAESPNTRPQP